MTGTNANPREVALPAIALTRLRRALRKQVGPLETIHTLHEAGFSAGEALHTTLTRRVGKDLSALEEGRFWGELRVLMETRGWGRLTHERIHPGLGLLRARRWGECDPQGEEGQPGCALTAGILAHLLGRVAGGPIAVLEVSCGSRGDAECAFLFGSEEAVHEIYGLLLDGEPLSAALERL